MFSRSVATLFGHCRKQQQQSVSLTVFSSASSSMMLIPNINNNIARSGSTKSDTFNKSMMPNGCYVSGGGACRGGGGLFRASAPRLAVSARHFRFVRKRFKFGETHPLQKPWKPDPNVMYLVPVPIGNLKDITFRALETLKGVDYIVCANRASTRFLLDTLDVEYQGKLIHYQPDNGNERILEMIQGGSSLCFVVAQGTPGIGDAGADLTRFLISRGVRISALPGANAVTTALAMSPVSNPEGAFYFGNYLSTDAIIRIRQIRDSYNRDHPTIFFCNPNKLISVLQEFAALSPGLRLSVAHEMTKAHESLHSDTALKLMEFYAGMGTSSGLLSKGEAVIVVEGSSPAELEQRRVERELKERQQEALITARAAAAAAAGGADGGEKQSVSLSPAQIQQAQRRAVEKEVVESVMKVIEYDDTLSEISVFRKVAEALTTSIRPLTSDDVAKIVFKTYGGLGEMRKQLFSVPINDSKKKKNLTSSLLHPERTPYDGVNSSAKKKKKKFKLGKKNKKVGIVPPTQPTTPASTASTSAAATSGRTPTGREKRLSVMARRVRERKALNELRMLGSLSSLAATKLKGPSSSPSG